MRNVLLLEKLKRNHAENYSVRKMHQATRRAGWQIDRIQVARSLNAAGLQGGGRRHRKPLPTRPAGQPNTQPDLVEHCFSMHRPRQLQVADITYVGILTGLHYDAFITDVFIRHIVRQTVSAGLHTAVLVLLPLEHELMATGASRGRSG